jgi:hypothetical protein
LANTFLKGAAKGIDTQWIFLFLHINAAKRPKKAS